MCRWPTTSISIGWPAAPSGLTGADIRNLVNEAALWATRNGKDKVDMDDFEHARDKVLMGPKREEVLTGKEKRDDRLSTSRGTRCWPGSCPGADRVHKVTIIPRGRSLGVTQLLPEEDRLNIGESELHARLCFMLGGRAAEKLIFDEYSAGAENDLMQATQLARRMVTAWGMSERLGPVAYRTSEEHPFLGKEISRAARVQRAHGPTDRRGSGPHSARRGRSGQRAADGAPRQARKLAEALEEHEVLDEPEIEQLLGPSINRRAESNGRAAVDVTPRGPHDPDIEPVVAKGN